MQTITSTSTLTYARHIASKIAADLKRLQRLYEQNSPSDTDISGYLEEAVLLLNYNYLGTVIYGFKRNDKWVIALKYHAIGGTLAGGDDPGVLFQSVDLSGTSFSSFLTYSQAFYNLPESEQKRFKDSLPIERVSGYNSDIENGSWMEDKHYRSGNLDIQRSMIKRN